MMKWLKMLFKHKHHWKRIRTIWPYPYGYASYCNGCKTVIDFEPDEPMKAQDYEAEPPLEETK